MSQTDIIYITKESLMMIVLLAGPGLFMAMLVGLLIGIFQATTQIQEQTLAFVPKIVAVFLTTFLLASWLMQMITEFTLRVYEYIPRILEYGKL
ncbi:flagellar biosynthesis protein FliQ [Peptococcaceae bacterium]|nr:flagellar biosynthesis protein FliQ [Peptococcaceae bacterium]MCL0062598.1 flagellar biosynthesis protein FliQ [Peptococcaceae bacterium]